MDKIHCGGGVTTFQVPGGNVLAGAFAVCLKIKQQYGIAGVEKKPGDAGHLQAVGANAVHQNNHAFPRSAGDQPAMQNGAAGTGKLN